MSENIVVPTALAELFKSPKKATGVSFALMFCGVLKNRSTFQLVQKFGERYLPYVFSANKGNIQFLVPEMDASEIS